MKARIRFCQARLFISVLFVVSGLASQQTEAQTGAQSQTQSVTQANSKPAERQARKELSFGRHADLIPAVVFSPDGKTLASAGENRVKLTDVETGKERLTLKNSRGMSFLALAFSPNGRWLAGGQSKLARRKTQRKNGQVLQTLIYHGEVSIWDAQTGAVKATLNDNDDPVWGLAFSPDGKLLAVATGPMPDASDNDCKRECSGVGEVVLWDAEHWTLLRRFRGNAAFLIRALAFSPDGKTLAGGNAMVELRRGAPVEGKDRFEILLWEVDSGTLKHALSGHLQPVTALAFAPDGRLLASAGRDRALKLWDSQTYALKRSASEYMLSLDEMQTIADATGGKASKQAIPPISWLNALVFSADGKSLIGGGGDSIVRFYDVESCKLSQVLKPRGWPIQSGWIPPNSVRGPRRRDSIDIDDNPIIDSSVGATTGPDLWNLGSRMYTDRMQNRALEWPVLPGALNSMALSADGKTLALGNADGKVRLLFLD